MTPRDFFNKVAAMRAAQKGFFSTQKGDPEHGKFYAESKRLEAEIDNEIARVMDIMEKGNR